MSIKHFLVCWALVVVAGAAGCGKSADKAAATPAANQAASETKHDSWWCDEHGVPEGICGQCSTKLMADFKAKGDWCKEHDRPDSQCFVCHPELEAKFAAQYEAKYGKKPPKPGA